MGELLKEYEEVTNSLFEADKWRESKGAKDWEQVKKRGGVVAYTKYNKLLDRMIELQKEIHSKANFKPF